MTAMATLTSNILTILGEISLVCIFFFLVNRCFGQLYQQIIKIPLLKKKQTSAIRRQTRSFLLLLSMLLSLAIISVNGFLIYRGENVRDFSLKFIHQIPQAFWATIGSGIIKCIAAIIATIIVLRLLNLLLTRISTFAQNFDDISGNDQSVAKFFKAVKINISNVSVIVITIACAQFLILPTIITEYLYILLRIYAIIAVGLLILKAVAIVIDTLDVLSVKHTNPENLLQFYCRLRYLIPFLKHCLEYIIYVVMATLVVQQVTFIAKLADWGPVGVKLIAIFLFSRILISVIYLLVEELLLKSKNLTEAQLQQRQTITPLLKSTSKYLIYFGAGISTLDTVGIDTTPILAGAGIIGLAVGLGAQNLINDIVSGFFLLFENYYLVGDYIETDTASGYVEAIELRTTRIRHSNGQVHIVRNGDIKAITNYSKEFVYAAVDIGVNYDTNLDRVYKIIETTGHQLQVENDDILEATQVQGIEEFGDTRVSIHTTTMVKPGKHLRVQRTLRKLLKQAFDLEGIYPPVGETGDKSK
ncbi:MAG: mechanosensitive ion channel family protein [Cyanobacteria bacterium P01_G01_bin.67]